MTHEKETFKSADPAISPCSMPGWSLLASNGRETKGNVGGRRYGYIQDKQEKGGREVIGYPAFKSNGSQKKKKGKRDRKRIKKRKALLVFCRGYQVATKENTKTG